MAGTVSGGWYIVMGFFDLCFAGFGSYIYYLYNMNIDASYTVDMHPILEWTYESYAIVGSYGGFFFFWFFNLLFDHNGGVIDGFTFFLSKVMIFTPIAILFGAFYVSSSYGDVTAVALGTDWAFTLEDDPEYAVAFNVTLILSVLNLIFMFTARGSLSDSYDEKVNVKL